MKRTKTPTAPGLYWYRGSVGGWMIVKLYEYYDGEIVVRWHDQDGEQSLSDVSGEWAGPILPPEAVCNCAVSASFAIHPPWEHDNNCASFSAKPDIKEKENQ